LLQREVEQRVVLKPPVALRSRSVRDLGQHRRRPRVVAEVAEDTSKLEEQF
jgi:hypothetical protein